MRKEQKDDRVDNASRMLLENLSSQGDKSLSKFFQNMKLHLSSDVANDPSYSEIVFTTRRVAVNANVDCDNLKLKIDAICSSSYKVSDVIAGNITEEEYYSNADQVAIEYTLLYPELAKNIYRTKTPMTLSSGYCLIK